MTVKGGKIVIIVLLKSHRRINDLFPRQRSKLCFLAPFALATTASEGSLGVVRSDGGRWARLEECVYEACAVAVAKGAKVAPEPILTALEGLPDGFRSSMQKDVAARRTPELDAIAGPILRGGREHGIDVPATCALVDRVVALE